MLSMYTHNTHTQFFCLFLSNLVYLLEKQTSGCFKGQKLNEKKYIQKQIAQRPV